MFDSVCSDLMRKFPIVYRDGTPIISEFGGPLSQPGFAQVVCRADGEALFPISVTRRGEFEKHHAWFECTVGLFILTAVFDRDATIRVSLWQIEKIEQGFAQASLILETETGRFRAFPEFDWASLAVTTKLRTYCDEPMYFLPIELVKAS